MKRLVCAVILAALASIANSAVAQPEQSARSVDVTGHGEAKAKPDTVMISFAVENQADTADACTAQHAEKVRKLIDALQGKLGSGAKITTGDYSLNPTTIYAQSARSAPSAAPRTPWRLSMGVSLQSDSFDALGKAVDTAIAAGASNRIQTSGFEEVRIASASQPSGSGGSSFLAPGPAVGSRSREFGGPAPALKQVAFVTVEIDTEGATVDECMHKAGEILNRIRKEVDKNAIQVGPSSLNLTQQEPQQQTAYVQPPPPAQKQVFQAHSTITAETTDLDKLGEAVQTGVSSGASRLNNITFTLSNDSAARREAVDKAAAEAKSKAEEVAKSMGVKLGKILKISTNAVPRPQVIYGGAYQGSFSTAQVSAPVQAMPVMPREVGFTADVSVSYAIE